MWCRISRITISYISPKYWLLSTAPCTGSNSSHPITSSHLWHKYFSSSLVKVQHRGHLCLEAGRTRTMIFFSEFCWPAKFSRKPPHIGRSILLKERTRDDKKLGIFPLEFWLSFRCSFATDLSIRGDKKCLEEGLWKSIYQSLEDVWWRPVRDRPFRNNSGMNATWSSFVLSGSRSFISSVRLCGIMTSTSASRDDFMCLHLHVSEKGWESILQTHLSARACSSKPRTQVRRTRSASICLFDWGSCHSSLYRGNQTWSQKGDRKRTNGCQWFMKKDSSVPGHRTACTSSARWGSTGAYIATIVSNI